MVVLAKTWLYSGKCGCIRAKGFYLGKSGCNRAKWLNLGRRVLY